MKMPPSITIMFPFLNDWGTVGSLTALAIETAGKYTDDWEVVIVNDGSKPKDREALGMIVNKLNLKSKIKNPNKIQNPKNNGSIRIIDHKENKGYGGALRSG